MDSSKVWWNHPEKFKIHENRYHLHGKCWHIPSLQTNLPDRQCPVKAGRSARDIVRNNSTGIVPGQKTAMMKLKEMNLEDRPRERLVAKGPGALGNAELTAILLRTGGGGLNVLETAQALLASAGSLSGLSAMSLEKMMETRGIGLDKAVTVSAAFELGRRFAAEKAESPEQITSARQIRGMMHPLMKGLDHEECWVFYLNRANRIIYREKLTTGGQSSTVMDPGMVIRKALEKKALGLILCHNHPSGSPMPGNADIRQTEALKKAAETFGISLLDHVIICDNCYYSFADEEISWK